MRAPSTQPPKNVTLRDWIGVYSTLLGAFMAVLDNQITNASLNDITGALGVSISEGAWISTAYLVAEIVVIPLTGWLSQVFSVRLYLLVNAALFICFSITCAFATSLPQMILFRAGQGFAGGVFIPMAFVVILTTLPQALQPITRDRIDKLTQMFLQHTSDPVQAQNQAYAVLDRTIRREANVMAFNDCFFFMGCALFTSAFLVLFLKKVLPPVK
jgi:Major Facilitator Superfamily